MSASAYPVQLDDRGYEADTVVGKLVITKNPDDDRYYVSGTGINPEFPMDYETLASFKNRRNAIQYAKRNQHRVVA